MSVITVNQLVLDAFLLTGQWDNTHLPTNGEMSRGIAELKYLIDASPSIAIPFQKTFTWELETGKRSYTFSESDGYDFESRRIQRINSAFVTWNNVTHNVIVLDQVAYYQSSRVNTVESLPKICVLENNQDYSEITVYPKPDISYEITIKYIEDLGDFTAQQPINNIPTYMFQYIRYELASILCDIYSVSWSPKKEERLRELKKSMNARNFHDIVVRVNNSSYAGYARILSGI